MNAALVTFWILAILSVGSAVGVVLHRNPIRCALMLIVNFMALAVLYVIMNAQVLAALQVIVYAGAIMVLFLFVIQLLNLGGELAVRDPLAGQKALGLVLGVLMLGGLAYGIQYLRFHPQQPGPDLARIQVAEGAEHVSQIQIIGWDLFTRYVYPFELTSVLLLVGAVGIILLTKRRAADVSHVTPVDATNR